MLVPAERIKGIGGHHAVICCVDRPAQVRKNHITGDMVALMQASRSPGNPLQDAGLHHLNVKIAGLGRRHGARHAVTVLEARDNRGNCIGESRQSIVEVTAHAIGSVGRGGNHNAAKGFSAPDALKTVKAYRWIGERGDYLARIPG